MAGSNPDSIDRASAVPAEATRLWAGLLAGLPSRSLALVLQLLASIIIARALEPSQFGTVAVVVAIVGLIGVASSHLSQQTARIGEVGAGRAFLPASLGLGFALASVSGLAIMILPSNSVTEVMTSYLPVILLAPVASALSGAAVSAGGSLLVVSQVGRPALRVTFLAVSLLAVQLTPMRLGAIDSLASLMMVLMLIAVLRRRHDWGTPGHQRPTWMRFGRASAALAGVSASALLLDRLDMLMLAAMGGTVVSGQYELALRVTAVPMVIYAAALTTILPSLSSLADNRQLRSHYERAALTGIMLTVPLAVGIGVWGGEIVTLAFGSRYLLEWYVYALLAASVLVHAGFGPNGFTLIARYDHRTLVLISLAQVALNFTLNLVLIPLYSAGGAALATLLSYIVVNFFLHAYLQRSIGALRASRWIMPGLGLALAALIGALWPQFLQLPPVPGLLVAGASTTTAVALVAWRVPRAREVIDGVLETARGSGDVR